MKGFRTYIITKQTLMMACAVILILILVITSVITLYKKSKANDTVTAFSNVGEKILDEGVVSEKDTHTVKKIAEDILGFDAEDPVSIIKSSNTVYDESTTPEPTKATTPSPTVKVPEVSPVPSNQIKINNATNYTVDINELIELPLDLDFDKDSSEVLIIHTHTTECYDGNEMAGEGERTTNDEYNMCHIGEVLANTLNLYGIKTIHDKTIHDYPSYQGAYTRALKTIEKNLSEHPSIRVILDIHRDAYIYADGSKLRVSTEINGEDAAQVMIVLGTDSMGLEHSHWKSNLAFAAKLQNTVQGMYPDLMRPLNLRRERFNMHMSKGSLLLEIGSNGNSIDEAERSAQYIGNAIASVLING